MNNEVVLQRVIIRGIEYPKGFQFNLGIKNNIQFKNIAVSLQNRQTAEEQELKPTSVIKDDPRQMYMVNYLLENHILPRFFDLHSPIDATLVFQHGNSTCTYSLTSKSSLVELSNPSDRGWKTLEFERVTEPQGATLSIPKRQQKTGQTLQKTQIPLKRATHESEQADVGGDDVDQRKDGDDGFKAFMKSDASVHKNCVPRHESIKLQERIRELEQQLRSKSTPPAPGDQNRIAELDEQLAKMRANFEDAIAKLAQAEEQKQKREQELQALHEQNQAMDSEAVDQRKLHATMEQQKKTIAALQAKITALESANAAELKELKKTNERLRARNTALRLELEKKK